MGWVKVSTGPEDESIVEGREPSSFRSYCCFVVNFGEPLLYLKWVFQGSRAIKKGPIALDR